MFGFLEVLDLLKQVFIFFGYFTNSGSFPKPLSKEEEQELFVKFYEYKNSDAKEKLINHNLRLVAHIIKKYYETGHMLKTKNGYRLSTNGLLVSNSILCDFLG